MNFTDTNITEFLRGLKVHLTPEMTRKSLEMAKTIIESDESSVRYIVNTVMSNSSSLEEVFIHLYNIRKTFNSPLSMILLSAISVPKPFPINEENVLGYLSPEKEDEIIEQQKACLTISDGTVVDFLNEYKEKGENASWLGAIYLFAKVILIGTQQLQTDENS